jgi:protein-S-isoprenylcysteine O-methyltransferase Ste14
MATDVVCSTSPAQQAAMGFRRLTALVVRRRVPISIALFGSLIAIDILAIGSRPRNLLDIADPLAMAGLAGVAMGLAIRSWAAGTLRKQRELATTGPYAWIRHPLYFGSFLMMVGFGTLVHDPITLWVVAGPVAWLYWQAMRSEERTIAELFPTQWPAYAKRVPRIFPYRPAAVSLAHWSLAQWLRNSEYRAWLGSAVALVAIKLWQMWG